DQPRATGRVKRQRELTVRARDYRAHTNRGADSTMLNPALRDPAFLPRLALSLLAVIVLWPGIELSEVDLAVLFDTENSKTMGNFLSGFWPPAHTPDFL